MEKLIQIESDTLTLEAAINKTSGPSAVVVCHPHPQYGGNMDNMVVTSIADAFFNSNFTTLRFNFRGVGNSSGAFDDGIGEQEDVLSAIQYLKESGFTDIWLAGYSFGSKITASVVSNGVQIKDHIMVAPPVNFMSFEDVSNLPQTGLIITGEFDEFAPPKMVEQHIANWKIHPQFEVIDDCDHFFSTGIQVLEDIILTYLEKE